jgi:hypothetical protein
MTNPSIHFQFKKALEAQLGAIPSVGACYLDRVQPVGENETKPVIIFEEIDSDITDSDGLGTSVHAMFLHIKIHVDTKVGEGQISEVTDPWWQAVHSVMTSSALRSLPGVAGIKAGHRDKTYRIPNAEGDAARLDLLYTVFLSTTSHDVTIPI